MVNFEQWMTAQGLSQSSVEKYSGAIRGRLSNWASTHKFIIRPLGEILDPVEFEAVAKLIKGTDEYLGWNRVGHHMYGAALKKFHHYLIDLSSKSGESLDTGGPHRVLVSYIQSEEDLSPFDPKGLVDARERALREVVQRRGQPKFRRSLIKAYSGKCVVTGCTVLAILEAAHITPYLGAATNSVTNGLLLRADVHTLWDLGLIAIEPMGRTVWVSPTIDDATYTVLSGIAALEPNEPRSRPSTIALQQQWHLVRCLPETI